MRTISKEKLQEVLRLHKLWYENKKGGKRANLYGANLKGADLHKADLRYAYLRGANLRYADLQNANLQGAYLQEANLREANLDFSCFPLWCGSFGMKADDRLVSQLLAHIARLGTKNMSIETSLIVAEIATRFGDMFCEYRNDIKKVNK